jgi:hypothetical protein
MRPTVPRRAAGVSQTRTPARRPGFGAGNLDSRVTVSLQRDFPQAVVARYLSHGGVVSLRLLGR